MSHIIKLAQISILEQSLPPSLVHEPTLELYMTTAQGGHLLVHPPGLSEPLIEEAVQMNIYTPIGISLDKMSRDIFYVQYTNFLNLYELYRIIKSNIDNPSEQRSVSTFNTLYYNDYNFIADIFMQ